jgi:spore cortex formation protein SpoVR/YcgB (stage V sporulation)
MNLQDLEILEDDFDLFVALEDKNKIEFLFDAIEIGTEASSIKQVSKLMKPIKEKIPIVQTEDFQVGKYRLCVTTTKKELQLNSNSLRVINKYLSKLVNDGLILQRIKSKKTKHDLYKYLRSYKIIGFGGPFSSN